MDAEALTKAELLQITIDQHHKIQHLEFELAQLKRAIFGSKSERFVAQPPEQTSLFEEQETQYVAVEAEQRYHYP